MSSYTGKKQLFGLVMTCALALGMIAASSVVGYSQGYGGYGGYGSNDGYPNWGGSYQLRQTALNAGFNEGRQAGAQDRASGRQRNLNDFREYRDATKDYNSRYGDRGLYQQYFRIAFERGYAEAFPNNGYYNGNNGGYYGNNGNYRNDRNRNDRDNDNWNNRNRNNGSWNNGGWNNGDWNNNGQWDRNRRGTDWNRYGNYGGSYQLRQTALNAGYNEGVKQGRNDRNRGPRNLSDFSQYRNANKDYNSSYGDFGMYQRYYREGFSNGYHDGLLGY